MSIGLIHKMPKETIPGLSPEQEQIQKERGIKHFFGTKKQVAEKIHEQALEEKEQREIEQVTFDDVLQETMTQGSRTLKTNNAIKSELPNLLKAKIINIEEAETLLEGDYTGGAATRSHLMRLLGRGQILGLEHQGGFSEAEYNLAHAFLKYGKEIREELEQNEIRIVINKTETKNTCKWWTHAPYVYETLLEKGLKPEEAFRKTLLWGKLNDFNKDDLLGLEELKDLDKRHKRGDYILSAHPQGASHRFAKKMARKIVDEILKEND